MQVNRVNFFLAGRAKKFHNALSEKWQIIYRIPGENFLT